MLILPCLRWFGPCVPLDRALRGKVLPPPFCKQENQGQDLTRGQHQGQLHSFQGRWQSEPGYLGGDPGTPSPPSRPRSSLGSSPGDQAPCPAFFPLKDRDPRHRLGHRPRGQLSPGYRAGSSRQGSPAAQAPCWGRRSGGGGGRGSAAGGEGWVKIPQTRAGSPLCSFPAFPETRWTQDNWPIILAGCRQSK